MIHLFIILGAILTIIGQWVDPTRTMHCIAVTVWMAVIVFANGFDWWINRKVKFLLDELEK